MELQTAKTCPNKMMSGGGGMGGGTKQGGGQRHREAGENTQQGQGKGEVFLPVGENAAARQGDQGRLVQAAGTPKGLSQKDAIQPRN